MMNRAKIAYGLQQGKGLVPTALILFFSGGIAFLIWGVFELFSGRNTGFFVVVMGIIFIVIGITSYMNLKNIRKK
jgi:hypothetical protein